MKISYASDLHIEFDYLSLQNKDNSDVLILAGDIIPIKYISSDTNDILKFFEEISEQWKDVIIVIGNHEAYRGVIEETKSKLKSFIDQYLNIHVLENDYIEIDDIRFIGSTLWTNFYKNDPVAKETARVRMNDFKIIRTTGYRKFLPDDSVKLHYKAYDYIRNNLNHDKVVLITHHAPCLLSIPERYKTDILSAAYASDLSLFDDYPQIKIAIHGHIHDTMNYEVNETRILCNPRGYPGEECFRGFQLQTIEI